jgi:uncharacterized protein (DUF736 family)
LAFLQIHGGNITDKIRTITLIAARPANRNQTSTDAPAYRIFSSNKPKIGATWENSPGYGPEIPVRPAGRFHFHLAAYASPLEQEDGTHNLIWSRRK